MDACIVCVRERLGGGRERERERNDMYAYKRKHNQHLVPCRLFMKRHMAVFLSCSWFMFSDVSKLLYILIPFEVKDFKNGEGHMYSL